MPHIILDHPQPHLIDLSQQSHMRNLRQEKKISSELSHVINTRRENLFFVDGTRDEDVGEDIKVS